MKQLIKLGMCFRCVIFFQYDVIGSYPQPGAGGEYEVQVSYNHPKLMKL